MNKYRGNTFTFPFLLKDESGNAQGFQIGDIVRFGMKENIYTNKYALYRKLKITEATQELQFTFTPEETQKIEQRKYIVELELERNGQVDTIYQEEMNVKGVVIDNVPEVDSSSETSTENNSQTK